MRHPLVRALAVALALTLGALAQAQADFTTLARVGTLEQVRAALADGADPNARDDSARTPLMEATRNRENASAIIELLLAAGAEPNARNANGVSALLYAIEYHPNAVPLLLAAGANPNARDSRARTALHHAATVSTPEVVQSLLEAGADPNLALVVPGEAADGATPLMLASAANQRIEIMALLIEAGADVTARNTFGLTTIHLAAMSGQADVVRLLLDEGVDPNIVNANGNPPLHGAAIGGYPDVVRILLERGANANARDESGATALLATNGANAGATEVVELLLAAGTDANARYANGSTALHNAVHHHHDAVPLLLAAGADPNALTANAISPLHIAAMYAPPGVVRALLEAGAEVNVTMNNPGTISHGGTPLIAAAISSDHPEVLDLLLDAGADPNMRSSGLRAIDLAQDNPALINTPAYWRLHDASFE